MGKKKDTSSDRDYLVSQKLEGSGKATERYNWLVEQAPSPASGGEATGITKQTCTVGGKKDTERWKKW